LGGRTPQGTLHPEAPGTTRLPGPSRDSIGSELRRHAGTRLVWKFSILPSGDFWGRPDPKELFQFYPLLGFYFPLTSRAGTKDTHSQFSASAVTSGAGIQGQRDSPQLITRAGNACPLGKKKNNSEAP